MSILGAPLIAQLPQATSTYSLTGTIQTENGDPIISAYIQIEGTILGTLSDASGNFKLTITQPLPIYLVVSMPGFATQRIEVRDTSKPLQITLIAEYNIGEEVVVSASRISETLMQSPVSIEKVDILSIKETASLNAYDALASIKGVDIITSSINFKSINTRCFNTPLNARFVQRIDGIDLQAPGVNVPIGTLSGSTDLDIESIELVPGTSSALYGPNAFNGLLNITTKSPFKYPGLSAQLKAGFNHLDNKDSPASLIGDFSLRYAKIVHSKFAFKLNFNYTSAQDWHANDTRDVSNYTGTNDPRNKIIATSNREGNPGYDGLNIYGDEVANIFDRSLNPFLDTLRVKVARTGYHEHDLTNYQTGFWKIDAALHYKLSKNAEVSLNSRYSRINSLLHADNRINLKDLWITTHKIELQGSNYFLRAYATLEDAGDAYDMRFAAMNINRLWKSDTNWFAQYQMVYSGTYNLIRDIAGLNELPKLEPFNDATARNFADSNNETLGEILFNSPAVINFLQATGQDPNMVKQLFRGQARFLPGSLDFNNALEKVRKISDFNRGAQFVDHSRMYHIEGQYDFAKHIKFVQILAGTSLRIFELNSRGVVFGDTAGPFHISEFGIYAQATKTLAKEKLKLIGSLRLDKAPNFLAQISPRIASVTSFGKKKQHNVRASYQTGFRMPDLRHRYLNFSVATYRVIGGFEDAFQYHGLIYTNAEGQKVQNAFTIESVENFLRARAKRNPEQRRDPLLLIQDSLLYLKKQNMAPIKPEFIQALEVGYKGMLLPNLMLDAAVYYSRYTSFIGAINFVGPARQDVGTPYVALTAKDLDSLRPGGVEQFQRFRRYANAEKPVTTWGSSVGIILFLNSKFTFNTNYTYAQILSQEDKQQQIQTEFNTPRHKVNISLTARNLWKFFGFGIQYRYNEAFFFQYSFASGIVPTYHLVDAQLSYYLPKMKTQLKLGGTNILNNRHIEVFGGPTIGTVVYLQLTYDSLLN
ncbi:MAG: carboxypeptidase-like regulatory domain-containing protein [Bacteroidia bacterium]|nr:TonB-dependent receptor [Bacteroidia bacterium]MDW8159198.1 carboxypeptidase-like regulatory domain-containing protein [Bacteroidia bacterium]